MVVISADTSGLVEGLEAIKGRYQAAAEKGFAEAGRMVVDMFRNDWLSGRGGDGLGLNIQTGRLHDSIASRALINGNRITSEVYNRGAQYWYYHEFPEAGRHKYLYLEEAFQEDGAKLYEGQVELALKQVS